MKLADRALPLTRRQLDIWLAQETSRSGTGWQLGLFVRIEGTVTPDLLEHAIRQALQEAEPVRAAISDRPCRQWSKTRWLDQAVPTSKSNSTRLRNQRMRRG